MQMPVYVAKCYRTPENLNLYFHYFVHESSLLVPTMKQINPVDTIEVYELKTIFILAFYLLPSLTVAWSLQVYGPEFSTNLS